MYTRTHTHSGLKTVLRTLRPSAAKCWGLHGLLVSEPGLERCFPVTASCTPPRRGSGIWPQKCLLGGSGKIWDILRVSSPPAPHQFQYYLFIIYFFILFYFFYLTSHLMFYFFCIGVYLIYNVVVTRACTGYWAGPPLCSVVITVLPEFGVFSLVVVVKAPRSVS